MATGFKTIQRNTVNKDPGYKTLFERKLLLQEEKRNLLHGIVTL